MLKNVDDGPQGPYGGGGWLGPLLGSKRCVVNLYGYDKQKSNSAHESHFSALGLVMAYDP
jgi:hypothetical protein